MVEFFWDLGAKRIQRQGDKTHLKDVIIKAFLTKEHTQQHI